MDPNIAAWMIAGGPRLDTERTQREREQLHAYLERDDPTDRGPGFLERIRHLVRPAAAQPACCVA